jgi:hypothetical protein
MFSLLEENLVSWQSFKECDRAAHRLMNLIIRKLTNVK